MALLMHQARVDGAEQELFPAGKRAYCQTLDVANTGREVHPLGRRMIFLVIVQASVQGLSQSFLCTHG